MGVALKSSWLLLTALLPSAPGLRNAFLPLESCSAHTRTQPVYAYTSRSEARDACIAEGCTGLLSRAEDSANGARCAAAWVTDGNRRDRIIMRTIVFFWSVRASVRRERLDPSEMAGLLDARQVGD